MSELKIFTSERIYWAVEQVEREAGDIDDLHLDDNLFYLKSEADKVIAELKKERDWLAKDRAQAYDDLEKRAQLNIKQEESNRHQKYKRCLNKAEFCDTKADWYYGIGRSLRPRVDFYIKWRDKWLKIAEMFKEAK